MKSLRTAVLIVLTLGSLYGCSDTFGDKLSEHRYCVGVAQIQPQKVDDCLRDTNGHREQIDSCLSGAMVPDRKIAMLNDCVESSEHGGY
ncbi:MAG TPA: hypothetical protein VFB15_03965 [Candidatus Binataceae bacterium]|jgi:hypothetical protein|nr:hypothetical protein [Candidatus Binataceae bacterium]